MKTDAELLAILDEAIGHEYGAQAAFAKRHKINPNLLSEVRSGKRPLIPSIACALGYRKALRWERVKNGTV